jgi:hypothetical protein
MALMIWIVSILLLGVFLYIALLHAALIFSVYVLKQKGSSMVPLFAGICGALGIVLLPVKGSAKYWWLPLLLDYGSIPLLLHTLLNNCKSK